MAQNRSQRSRKCPEDSSVVSVPPSGGGPGVLVLHAWWGLNAFFRDLCQRLASEGFVALAPDLYGGQVANTIAEAERLRSAKRSEPAYKTLTRALGDLQRVEGVVGTGVAVLGFSMGAHWALWLAQQPELPIGAAVAYYGARSGAYASSRAAFQGHYAEHDDYVSAGAVAKLRKTLAAAGRPAEFYTYPGTGHWFAESDRLDAYDVRAAELAWERTIAFLRQHLGR